MSVSVPDPETDIMDQFLDPETDIMGERTFMTRSLEHFENYRSSFMLKHQNTIHGGAEPDYRW